MPSPTVTKSASHSNTTSEKKNSTEFKIQRANWADMYQVAKFIRSSADWYRRFVDPKDMAEHEVGEEWITKNYFRREFYVGYEDKTPIGTISLQNLEGYSYLGYIYLDTKFVGRGYGHRLMNFALTQSQKLRRKGMVLIAHPEAKWAVKAYEKFGFKKVAANRKEVLAWNDGALKPYYEEGFDLYCYSF